jgi:adenylate kinase
MILGAPGSGKGTQGKLLAEHLGIPQVSTGELLRAAVKDGTPLGRKAGTYMDKGLLVPDEIIFGLIEQILDSAAAQRGVLMDGFPRTIPQAEAMKSAGVKLDVVLEIDVPDDAIIERMSGRRTHPASGRTYHVKFNPPKVDGRDDVTGEPLVQREDDREATVRKRLEVYHAQTSALVEYFSRWADTGDPAAPKCRRISGVGGVEEIRDRALAALA